MIKESLITEGYEPLTSARRLMGEDRPHDAVAILSSSFSLHLDPVKRMHLRILMDEALLKAGKFDEADAFWTLEDKVRKTNPPALERFVLNACEAGSFSRALSRLDEIAKLLPAQRSWLIRYRCLLGLEETEKAYEHIESAKNDLPSHVALRYRINVLLHEHRYHEVLDALSQAWGIRSSEMLHLQTRALIGTGEHIRVDTELASFREYFPEEDWIDLELARNATVARWPELALQRWQDLHRNRPGQLIALQGLVEVLLDKGEFSAVAQLLDEVEERHPRADISRLRARALSIEGDLLSASATLQTVIDELTGHASCATLASVWSELAQIHLSTAERDLQQDARRAHLACARQAHVLLPDSLTFKVKLADALIRSDMTEEAKAMIGSLPATNRDIVLRLQMWCHAAVKDQDTARAVWKKRKLIHYIPQVHAGRFANLHRIDENSLPPRDALTLYTCIRDERERLPWFFNYYRHLGVENFVVIDNGSSDGSTEYLLSQTGTTLFRTQDSYHGAFSGMVWINHLKSKLSPEAWVLYADVDEALVYDGCETHSILDLTEALDLEGKEAFTAFMLDMFSVDTSDVNADVPVHDYITRYPHYLPKIQVTPKPLCPYFQIRGGIRSLFATGEELTKTPLVKSSAGIEFLQSSHTVSPALVSDMTGILLHYKIIDGLADEAKRVLQDQTRSPHCRARYAKYRDSSDILKVIGSAMEDVRTYSQANDLVDAGLMSPIWWGE